MDWGEYLAIIIELEVSQSWVGRTLAKSPVTGRRWAAKTKMPDSATILLRLMRAGKITKADVVAAKRASLVKRK